MRTRVITTYAGWVGVGAWRGGLTGAVISGLLALVPVIGGVVTHDILTGLAFGGIVLGIGAGIGAAIGALVGAVIGLLPRRWRPLPTSAFGVVFVLTFATVTTMVVTSSSEGYGALHFETVGAAALVSFILGLLAGVATSGLEAG